MSQLSKTSEILLFCLVVAMIVFIPLYPKFPLLTVPGTFVAIRIEDLLIGVSSLVWLGYLILAHQLRNLLKDKLSGAILLFWGLGLVSLISGIFITNTVVPHLGFLHWFRRVELMLLLPIAWTAIKSRRQFQVCLATLGVVLLLVNLYALGQQYLNWPVISTTNSEFSKGLILYLTPGARVNSTFAGHYDLAVYLMMNLVVAAGLIFAARIYTLIQLGLLSLLAFFVLILTAARFSFVALLFGVMVSFWLSGKKLLIVLAMVVAVLVLIYPSQLRDRFISTVTVNLFSQGTRYQSQTERQEVRSRLNIPTLTETTKNEDKGAFGVEGDLATMSGLASDLAPGEPIDSTELGVYRSFQIRINYEWPGALRAWMKNPLLGTGYSSLGIATDNDFLRSLGEVGTLGTLAFGLVIWELVKRLAMLIRKRDRLVKYFSAGMVAMVLAFLVNGLFIDVLESSKVASMLWLVSGIGLAAAKLEDE